MHTAQVKGRPWYRFASAVRFWLGAFGLDPLRLAAGVAGFPRLVRDYVKYRRLARGDSGWPVALSAPCIVDRVLPSGSTGGHYFLQDLYVAQQIFRTRPALVLDVGSRIDGFVAHVASFRRLRVVDIRPLDVPVDNIEFVQADLTAPDLCESLQADAVTCLHALEHFGLGRYGDPIDPNGHLKGMQALANVTAPGGLLYLSVPIGRQRIEFNGHRVFSPSTLVELAAPWFDLEVFSYIDDAGQFHRAVQPFSLAGSAISYGCGIYQLRRRISDACAR